MVKASNFSIILITTDTMENARAIAKALVKEKFAACCTLIPGVFSVYEWKNNIEENEEIQVLIKTKTNKLDLVEEIILKHHSYDVPEIISLPLEYGHSPYLDWINSIVDIND